MTTVIRTIGAQLIQCGKPVLDLLLLWLEQPALLLTFFPENRSVSRPLRVLLLNSLKWGHSRLGSPPC